MEEEIEDIIGEIKYTDSQKSVATSNQYSLDFDSGSERLDSGKETYVIECSSWESEDSDAFHLHETHSVMNVNNFSPPRRSFRHMNVQYEPPNLTRSATTSLQKCYVAQETFTQTSRTIIELAEHDGGVRRVTQNNTLETQTSLISITENKTLEYKIETSSAQNRYISKEIIGDCNERTMEVPTYYSFDSNQCSVLSQALEDASSKFQVSEADTELETADDTSVPDKIIRIINDESSDNTESEQNENSDLVNNSDIEEDSLMANISDDVMDLHNLLSETESNEPMSEKYAETKLRMGTLTPLTEESIFKKDSLMDITPTDKIDIEDDVMFTSKGGLKVKLLKDDVKKKDSFRLPPIQNQSCPNSPHLNSLFNMSKQKLSKAGTLPCLYEARNKDDSLDRWEITTKDLASGEGSKICSKTEPTRKNGSMLPPIAAESLSYQPNRIPTSMDKKRPNHVQEDLRSSDVPQDSISIKEKIKELKMAEKTRKSWTPKYCMSRTESRSNSPGSTCSPDERLYDIPDRGCDALCLELLKRLRSSTWVEVLNTLEDIPQVMDKFWHIITETRIADLIRQVNCHIESPRPQLARAACSTVACILKNTNYTKKPDFYETITVLLTKTGSYSRPVRRAANMALDLVASGGDLAQCVTALCIHGVGHKSALVRCASARLLVVCCALGGGGRELLRARPASAATARRSALRSLAALLEDKNTEARKYAERLYSMLRPLPNFEAYYITDVDIELASRQMKKFDQTLFCGPAKEER